MKISFFKGLKSPIYTKRIFSGKEKPCGDEFAITSDWRIVIPRESSPQILVTANDLKKFLKIVAGVKISVVKSDSIPRNQEKHIFLRIKESPSKKQKQESYNIKCSAKNITIVGADASGVMYGIFYLEELMRFRKAPILKTQRIERKPVLETRIFRSPMAFFYHNELPDMDNAYPDEYLLKMAKHGFNGIWLRGVLRDLVKVSCFSEFGERSEEDIEHLNKIIKRCANYGIKVYFYFTEPLGLDVKSDFWSKHPEVKGEFCESQGVYALCSSTEPVISYLKDGFSCLFKNAPGLGGVILITASELHSNCWSHGGEKNGITCERCAIRKPSDVISEVITTINSGVKSTAPEAKVIAWNWSWAGREDDIERKIIESIPDDVILMADFERGGKREIDGFEHMVDEYSLSYIGPSERFSQAKKLADKLGKQVYAKTQIGVTHEIATVPYFPILPKIAEKYRRLVEVGGKGVMACWNFGNILSRNTELANWFSWSPSPESAEEILQKMAERDFGTRHAEMFMKAWNIFSQATDWFPFSNKFVYTAPMNFGAAYQFYWEKTDKPMKIPWLLPKEVKYNFKTSSMTKTEFGDNLEDFCSAFGIEQTLKCLEKMCGIWIEGIKLIKSYLQEIPEHLKENAEREYRVAAAIYSQFKSTIHFISFVNLRNQYHEEVNITNKSELLSQLEKTVKLEIENSYFLKELCVKEKQLGFHGEAFGYMYTVDKIDAKIKQTQNVLVKIKQVQNGTV
ncbi:MAG: glycoside hydrolase family 20 zincin-like fold domain-containing protein [Candidatus Theseobacter exili]|nr:glycoside hydrolase family 20 zincin-like fold domain-containing protein [Candidatus Theseobacter exili]